MPNTPKLTILDEANPRSHTQLDSEDFEKIQERFEDSDTVVTICVPMEKAGAETRKNPIVFKNAISEAVEKLSEREGEHRDLEFALRDLKGMDDEVTEFWQHQNKGLILFVDGGKDAVCLRLPFSVGPHVQVDNAPYVRPLHRLASLDRYYVLALDLNELKLYEAFRWSLNPIKLENVPTSLAEAMKYDAPEESIQFRSSSASSGKAGPAPIYHGQGVTTDATENEKIQRYFEMISKSIADNFPDRETELILLGPGSERARYREVNHYEKLSEYDIDLNPSNRSHAELTEIIGEHIETLGERSLADGLESLGGQIANERGSADLPEVVSALLSGKVNTLFYRAGANLYGTVCAETFKVDIHDEHEAGDTELIGYCAEKAIETGARLRVIASEELTLPGESPVAATYRY